MQRLNIVIINIDPFAATGSGNQKLTKHSNLRQKLQIAGNMGIRIGARIQKVNAKNLGYREFEENYLAKNQPVVLTGLMDDWRSCKDWVTDDGKPNLHFFSTHFGKSKVQVFTSLTSEALSIIRSLPPIFLSIFLKQLIEVSSFYWLYIW